MKRMSFYIKHAEQYGDREAIVIQYFIYWIQENKKNNHNFYDGRYWSYDSIACLAKKFPYWSIKQIRKIMDSLIKQDVLVSGNYNKNHYDRTKWYSFKNANMFLNNVEKKYKKHLKSGASAFAPQGKPIPCNNHSIELLRNSTHCQNEILTDIKTKKTFINKCSDKLYNALKEKRKVFRQVNFKDWDKQFNDMIFSDSIDKPRLKKVLNWYCSHIGQNYVPAAYSPSSFRDKFFAIEDAMSRDIGNVKISKKAKKIYNIIETSLPQDKAEVIIQQSLDNAKTYLTKHQQIKHKNPFTTYITDNIWNNPKQFVIDWLKTCQKSINNIRVFSINDSLFTKKGCQLAKDYCGRTDLWFEYLRLLESNLSKTA